MVMIKERNELDQKTNWQNSRISESHDTDHGPEPIGLEVLIVHEDVATGLRAKDALVNLENQIEIKTSFRLSLCRFGMLSDPQLAETALGQARRADIVFLSLHGDRDIAPVVRDWLLCWLETRDFKPCALVDSLDATARETIKSNSTLNFMRVITAPLEVDLFLHLGSNPLTATDGMTLVNRHVPVGKSWI